MEMLLGYCGCTSPVHQLHTGEVGNYAVVFWMPIMRGDVCKTSVTHQFVMTSSPCL